MSDHEMITVTEQDKTEQWGVTEQDKTEQWGVYNSFP